MEGLRAALLWALVQADSSAPRGVGRVGHSILNLQNGRREGAPGRLPNATPWGTVAREGGTGGRAGTGRTHGRQRRASRVLC